METFVLKSEGFEPGGLAHQREGVSVVLTPTLMEKRNSARRQE